MALSFLSACRLKSLRLDNGRSAKITLSGPGRARFLSPYPRPQPILPQPGLARSRPLGFSGPSLCSRRLHLYIWTPRASQAPAPLGRAFVATTVPVSRGNAGSAAPSWERCVGGSLRAQPKCHLRASRWDARKLRDPPPSPALWSFFLLILVVPRSSHLKLPLKSSCVGVEG